MDIVEKSLDFNFNKGDKVFIAKLSLNSMKSILGKNNIVLDSLPSIIECTVESNYFLASLKREHFGVVVKCSFYYNGKPVIFKVEQSQVFTESMVSAIQGFIDFIGKELKVGGCFYGNKHRLSGFILRHISGMTSFLKPKYSRKVEVSRFIHIIVDRLPKGYSYNTTVTFDDWLLCSPTFCTAEVSEDSIKDLIYTVPIGIIDGKLTVDFKANYTKTDREDHIFVSEKFRK